MICLVRSLTAVGLWWFAWFARSRRLTWLVGCLADWLTHWLTDIIAGWVAGWLANWLIGWLAGLLDGWLAGHDSLWRFAWFARSAAHVSRVRGWFWNFARPKIIRFSIKEEIPVKIEVEHDFFGGLSKRVTLKFSWQPSNLTRIGNPYDFAIAS